MSYPGITFVFMVSVAIGTAIFYYFNGERRQHQQHQHTAHGFGSDAYDYIHTNDTRSASPDSTSSTNSKRRRRGTQYDACAICLQDMKPPTIKALNCGHKYHVQCIKKWFEARTKNSCPICRSEQPFM